MSNNIELIVTGLNDGVAIIELDPFTSTEEDIRVLAEVQLGVPCTSLAVEVESPPDSGKFKRLAVDKMLSAQGVTEGGLSLRLVEPVAVPSPAAPSSSAAVPPTASAHTHTAPAAAPAAAAQQALTPDDMIRLLMSGGTVPAAGGGAAGGGVSVAAPTPQQYQQFGRPDVPPIDPMDPDYQKKLYEQIQQENVQHNLALAMEHTPEAFARVIMLYVPATCNKHKITAFVDSGAQMTIMNEQTAEKCGIMHLLDRRFGGVAKGVGSAKILGRVHMAMVTLGSICIPMSISVLEEQSMEFLIGLDQLRRHQMCIDLNKNVLRIGSDCEVPFLQEGELPDHLTNRMKEEEEAMSRAQSTSGV